MLRVILISAISLNLGLLFGRLSGFVREALVAANFGVSFEADIVVLMLTVPDLMVSLLTGGALAAVLVPVFSQSPQQARTLLYQSSLIFGAVFFVIAALLIWQAQLLISILAPGFEVLQMQHAAEAVTVVLWSIPLTVLAFTTTAFLHSQNRFVVASLGTLVVNLSVILGLYLVLIELISIETLAFFVILGGLMRLASQVGAIRPALQPMKYLRPVLLHKELFVRYGQAMLSGSLLFVFPVLGRAFASYEETGSVAVLNYAMRLIELPMAVCISFLTVILFPRLSQSYDSDPELHQRYIRYGIQATLTLAIIAAIMLILLADEYAALVYGYGDMSEANVGQVSSLISIGLLVLPVQGLAIYNIAIFNSRRDTRTPMIINAIGLVIFMGILKFEVFGEGLDGIMWGLVASFGFIPLVQMFRLKIERMSFFEVYFDKAFLAGATCSTALCVVWGYWASSLQLHLLGKMLVGFFGAIVCLLLFALFYTDIRAAIRTRLG